MTAKRLFIEKKSLNMEGFGTFLVLSCLLSVKAQFMHDDIYIFGCSDTDDGNMYGEDGEELWYADFPNKKGVVALPPFADPISFPGYYEQALGERDICSSSLAVAMKNDNNPPTTLDAPHSTIFTRENVELGVKNTLICHVTGFFPAPVRVRWTRNGENVTEGVRISTPYPDKDGSYNQFSRLTFTPAEGDIYSCSVQHMALTEPLTRMWDVDVSLPSVGPAVFCGVGLTLGLLGVATGTFFLIKGNECN